MDFSHTEAQQDLEQLTRSIAEKLTTNDRLRELDAAEDRFDDKLWQALADAGVLAAALPESVGGGGFGILEQCSVLRELGRPLAAVPYLSSIVLAASALAEFGDDAQRQWAQRAGAGEVVLTVALAEELNDNPAKPVTTAVRSGDEWLLTGTKITVPAAAFADLILVPATTPRVSRCSWCSRPMPGSPSTASVSPTSAPSRSSSWQAPRSERTGCSAAPRTAPRSWTGSWPAPRSR
ncbi:acyl-CoA dehydrogenase, N-terminal domain protein [Rhodococcus sp. MTM3W5.2]|nr:acyl-CoA dehydrogenase, N-terminal domain protein [Rhodococcus sp. MTM3W5.2]